MVAYQHDTPDPTDPGSYTSQVYVAGIESPSPTLVSSDTDGDLPDGHSGAPSINGDGTLVAFESIAASLTANDTNGAFDVFVKDLGDGQTVAASIATDGTTAEGDSYAPVISADGRYVAFVSAASDLVAGDTNGTTDVFVRDRDGGTTERVSVSSTGGQAAGASRAPSISDSGRYVAFESAAAELVAGDSNNATDIFLRDRRLGTTARVSVSTGGAQADLSSYAPHVSGDGSLVAFESLATNLVVGDTNAACDVFARDVTAATTSRLSLTQAGGQATGPSWGAALSGDGRVVSFHTEAADVVAGDANGVADVVAVRFGARTYTRLADQNRYSTAVRIAGRIKAANGGTWTGITDVILASGEDRAAADPLAAAGLVWAYDNAPVLLTSSSSVSAEVERTIADMAADNVGTPVTVHIVGGTNSIPDARFSEIAARVTSGSVRKDRIRATGNRFDLAASVAYRMRDVAASDPDKNLPAFVLVANGADSSKFFDALALSPIAAANGSPILLVSYDTVPSATRNVISTLAYPGEEIYVGGGPNSVSAGVMSSLGATKRLWGSDRYSTACAIATAAVKAGWLHPDSTGVAAKLPDALTGGAFIGGQGGPLLLTATATFNSTSASWLSARRDEVAHVYIFGGTASVSEDAVVGLKTALGD